MSVNPVNWALAKKDWDKAYDDLRVLEIGGRNYLKNSKDFNENWTKSGATNISIENADEPGFKQIKVMSSDVSTYIGQHTSLIGFDFSDENVEFSISVYAKGTEVGQTIGLTLGGGGIYLNYLPKRLTTEWKVYTWTFKGVGVSLQVFRFFCGGDVNTTNPIYWKMPKVEIGRKATEWSPAPEDIGAHPFVAELAETKYRSIYNEERINELENAIVSLGGSV